MNIKCHQKNHIFNKQERGSVSLEAAIILPPFMFFCIILLYILQAGAAYTRMNRAVCKTAETLGAYACLYHNHGIEALEDRMIDKVGKLSEDDNLTTLKKFLNIRILTDSGDDLLYDEAARKLYEYYYEKDEYFNGPLSESYGITFLGSEFFNDNKHIKLCASAYVKPFVNIPTEIFPAVRISAYQKVNCWLYGKVNSTAVISVNVWKMDNLSRGKYLRNHFGANLDEYYPVVSVYSGGTVTMIKSLDHTKKTYQNKNEFKKAITSMIDTLSDFRGTDNEKYKDYVPVIKESDIKKKYLLLVFPSNEMSKEQEDIILELLRYAAVNGVNIKIERYGLSE